MNNNKITINNIMRKIKSQKGNTKKLLDFIGYKSIRGFRKDYQFIDNKQAYTNIIDLYNDMVDNFNISVKKDNINKKKQNKQYYIYDKDTKEIAKLNKSNNPLLYQSFNINKNIIPKENLTTGDIVFKSNIPKNQDLNLHINWSCWMLWSGDENDEKDWFFKEEEYNSILKSTEIERDVRYYIAEAYSNPKIKDLEIIVRSVKTNQTLELIDMELKDQKPLNICNLYNEIIPNEGGNCIQKYMTKIYPKYSKKKISQLKTTQDIYDYCKINNIKMIAYDIQGNIIKKHTPEGKNKSRKSMVYIAYNNHLYPIKNKVLNKVNIDDKALKPKFVYDIILSFEEIVKSGYMPSNLFMINETIKSFIHNGYSYHSNKEYDICLDILTKYGIEDKMTPLTNLKNIGEKIAELYVKGNVSSFIPENNKIQKGGWNFHNKNVLCDDNTKEFITIDQVKCYSSILSNLGYLITCDVKKHKLTIVENNDVKIIDHYLYMVNPKYSSQLLPSYNIYSGEHIKLCLNEGLEFDIKEEMETDKVENYYKQMIIDLYNKIDPVYFKTIINVMIGKFESCSKMKTDFKISKIVNETELAYIEDGTTTIKICEGLHAVKEPIIKYQLYNKKPISIQIKDKARVKNYLMMKELKLNFNDIKQVKTDSITFIQDVFKTREYLKYIKEDLGNWKLENYQEQQGQIPNNLDISFQYNTGDKHNIFGNCYAGCGKSHKIINHYLKDDSIKNDYIILTPSHATAKQYRKLGHNAKVVQLYSLTNKIPTEKNIIVDEIGMVDNCGWGVLYKCKLNNKRLIGYGDRNQLLPIGTDTDYFSDNWISYMFGSNDYMDTNYRNNFNKDYYDFLITCKDKKKLITEIKKYNSNNFFTAEIIIAYRNDTRRHYNKLMCDRLGIKNKFDIGTKLICKTNEFKNIGLFNNLDCIVKYCDGDIVILNDEENDYKIDIAKLKHFEYGYARTLHSIQGDSIKSYYYPDEDLIPFFIDNRTTYTLISRLKNK